MGHHAAGFHGGGYGGALCNSLAGDFVWSLVLSDTLTGWTECRATWNKGSSGMLDQIKETCCATSLRIRPSPSSPVRTPYQKNDNAHVEQKNWTDVRQLFDYERFYNPELTKLMNALYAKEWSQLQNHFCPTLKLKQKEQIGARYRKQ